MTQYHLTNQGNGKFSIKNLSEDTYHSRDADKEDVLKFLSKVEIVFSEGFYDKYSVQYKALEGESFIRHSYLNGIVLEDKTLCKNDAKWFIRNLMEDFLANNLNRIGIVTK